MATSGVYLTYQSGLGHQVLPPSLSPSLLQGIGWQTPPAILNFCSPGAGLPFPNCLSLYSPTISATQALLSFLPFTLLASWPPGSLPSAPAQSPHTAWLRVMFWLCSLSTVNSSSTTPRSSPTLLLVLISHSSIDCTNTVSGNSTKTLPEHREFPNEENGIGGWV